MRPPFSTTSNRPRPSRYSKRRALRYWAQDDPKSVCVCNPGYRCKCGAPRSRHNGRRYQCLSRAATTTGPSNLRLNRSSRKRLVDLSSTSTHTDGKICPSAELIDLCLEMSSIQAVFAGTQRAVFVLVHVDGQLG